MEIRNATAADLTRIMEIYAYAREYMAVHGNPHLRADTHPDNKTMQNLLNKLGFEKRGIIHVIEDEYPRYAYEKVKC